MDDDEDERDFSKSIVYDFFTQAESTFEKMDSCMYVWLQTARLPPFMTDIMLMLYSESKDLAQLSSLGHFLKGSSATLGLSKVKDSCEKIQHYGAQKDETGTMDEPDKEKCLSRLKTTIAQAKTEFQEAEKVLRRFYHDED